jgi:hypothetical protein
MGWVNCEKENGIEKNTGTRKGVADVKTIAGQKCNQCGESRVEGEKKRTAFCVVFLDGEQEYSVSPTLLPSKYKDSYKFRVF